MMGLMVLGMMLCDTCIVAQVSSSAPGETLIGDLSPEETDAQRQLRINRTALLQGQTEESRMDAAVELLRRTDSGSRELLLQSLIARDNPLTRQAICRALIKSHGLAELVYKPDDFFPALLGVLSSPETSEARLAAEGLLQYPFSRVIESLSRMAFDPSLDAKIRLNVIYALKLWPEREAISTLGALRKDNDKPIAAAAEKALLELFGLPESSRSSVLDGMIRDYQNRQSSEIIRGLMGALRDRLAKQQEQIRLLGSDRDIWKAKYLSMTDKEYAAADDASKSDLLIAKLTSELPAERLWALGKMSTFAATPSAELRTCILSLVSDPDRDVRLGAARVLANKSSLDPAEKLLAQLSTEKDSEVSLAMFGALGEACSFAFTPGSLVKLPETVKVQTLDLAGIFLADKEPERAFQGAEVLRKLLELNGIETGQAQGYLQRILSRYEQIQSETGMLRGQLLGVMAKLCGKPGIRDVAGTLYQPVFLAALNDTSDAAVRESAAQGLVNVSKPKALEVFKERKLAEDPSPGVRRIAIALAGSVGDVEELDWLAKRLDVNGESEAAWTAMSAILQRQGSTIMLSWVARLKRSSGNAGKVTELLSLAETRLLAEKNAEQLLAVRIELLNRYLSTGDIARSAGVFSRRLIEQKDIEPDDPMVEALRAYLGSEVAGSDGKTAMVNALGAITAPTGTSWPKWAAQLKIWQKQFLPSIPATSVPEIPIGQPSMKPVPPASSKSETFPVSESESLSSY